MAAIRIAGGKWTGAVKPEQMDPRLAREVQQQAAAAAKAGRR